MTQSGYSLDWSIPEVLVQESDGTLEGISRRRAVIMIAVCSNERM